MEKSFNRLRYATIAAILGTIYLFLLRSYGTVVAQTFDSYLAVQLTQVIAFCASATHVVFFCLFFKVYCNDDHYMLKNAALGAFIGSCLLLFLYLRNLCLVFQIHDIYALTRALYIEVLFPFAGTFLITVFFIILRKDMVRQQNRRMMTPVFAGLVGAAIQMFLVVLMTMNYLGVSRGIFEPELYRMVGIFLVPLLILQFLAYIFFYSSFYRELKLTDLENREHSVIIQE
ncbi:hypothetical protein JXB22_04265 [candidate division WOR-3 bacterium]|nr:hypothetical protein [candidate division WOR-3 bacterium]